MKTTYLYTDGLRSCGLARAGLSYLLVPAASYHTLPLRARLLLQTFLKRMTRALGRKDMDEARRIYASGKPAYTLDHLIREVRSTTAARFLACCVCDRAAPCLCRGFGR